MRLYLKNSPEPCTDCINMVAERPTRQFKISYRCARFNTPCEVATESCDYVTMLAEINSFIDENPDEFPRSRV